MGVDACVPVGVKHIQQQRGEGLIEENSHQANLMTCASARKAA
jgi:hypothetical protein